MISRYWRGLAKSAQADHYIEYLRKETFPRLRKISGFVDATILKRRLEHGVEFLVITRWSSMEAIEGFAGPDRDVAVVPEKVREMMVEFDPSVRHYEVVE